MLSQWLTWSVLLSGVLLSTHSTYAVDLPIPEGSRIRKATVGSGTLAVYESTKLTTRSRIVILIHGDQLNAYDYWRWADKSRQRSAAQDVAFVAPRFGSPSDGYTAKNSKGVSFKPSLAWNAADWQVSTIAAAGSSAVYTFDVLDALIAYYAAFPKVKHIALYGHSAGGQLVHRYATLRNPTLPSKVDITYTISDPNSYLYLNADRPSDVPSTCRNFNRYRWGLERYDQNTSTPLRSAPAIWATYASKAVTYAHPTDNSKLTEDTGCMYTCQGTTHLDRAAKYNNYLASLNGGQFPTAFRADWLVGLGHDGNAILNSDAVRKRIFVDTASSRAPSALQGYSIGFNQPQWRAIVPL